MCLAGGIGPQDQGRASCCSCVCGMFIVWVRAVHPRPSATPLVAELIGSMPFTKERLPKARLT
jgi:hypothetical protein